MPTDCSQEGRDFAADRTATAPGASALSTMIASNLVPVSCRTASGASAHRKTSISSGFRTSPARLMISWSRENSSECNAIVPRTLQLAGSVLQVTKVEAVFGENGKGHAERWMNSHNPLHISVPTRRGFVIGFAAKQMLPRDHSRRVCPDFCVNDQVLFLGMGCRGRGQ